MNKYLRYGAIAFVGLAVISAGSYFYAFTTLKKEISKQGEINGFRLFFDGVVIKEFKINPSIELKQVYFHGTPWKLLQNRPKYIFINEADVNADSILSATISWPFDTKAIEIANLKIDKTILDQKITFIGSAKQNPETPLLVDFNSDNEKQGISGKAEIRIDNHQFQMVDISLDQGDIDYPLLKTKRGTGWLSFSFDNAWQIVGELDAGITLLGPYQFFDSTIKINGPVSQPEMTFSGMEEDQNIVIDQHEGGYFLRQGERTLPVAKNENVFPEIISTMDKIKQFQKIELAEAQEKQAQEEATQEKQKKKKDKTTAKPEEVKQETPPPVAIKIEPVILPEIQLQPLLQGTSLSGFIYKEPLVSVNQPCGNNIVGQCWTAHGKGGEFSYVPEVSPKYFSQLKDYEQSRQLRAALLNFKVESITVQGKEKTAQMILLKGTTSQNQAAEIQLAVAGLE